MRSCWLLTALAAFSGSCDMGAYTFIDSVGNKIAAAEQPLQTARLFLQSGADAANEATVKWATTDRRVLPVEIRIALVGWNPGIPANTLASMRDPILGYTLDIGTGMSIALQSPAATAIAKTGFALPARGAVARVLARDVLVRLRFDGHHDNPLLPTDPRFEWVDLAVSFTPCDDLTIAPPPTAAYSLGWTKPYQPFPPEANEFRIVDLVGKPYAANFSRDIYFRTAIGGILRNQSNADLVFDRAAFGDWTPISPRVAGWGVASGIGNWEAPGFGNPIPDPATDNSGYVTALYR